MDETISTESGKRVNGTISTDSGKMIDGTISIDSGKRVIEQRRYKIIQIIVLRNFPYVCSFPIERCRTSFIEEKKTSHA
jgi:hypothetical protein